MDIFLKENERIDDLDKKGLKIIQNNNWFCFGIDSILIANFAKNIKKDSKVVDFGTGTGIIGILLSSKTKLSKIYGIEIQKEVADMARRSIKLNRLEEKFEIINEDIKNIQNIIEKFSVDVIIMNPPYKKGQTGILNDNENKLISRHETTANLEDFIYNSSILLKNRGELYMIHKSERLVEILTLLKKYYIEPKIIQLVYPKIGSESNLVLIKAIKGAKPFLKVREPLIIYNEENKYTNEVLKIYNEGE